MQSVPLDFATEAGFLTSLFGGIVLLPLRRDAMRAWMVNGILGVLPLATRMELLENLASGLFAVLAFRMILRPFLVPVAILH